MEVCTEAYFIKDGIENGLVCLNETVKYKGAEGKIGNVLS
jgi:hypothetical protein